MPVRTFGDWRDPAPGFVEADLVAHCGHVCPPESGYLAAAQPRTEQQRDERGVEACALGGVLGALDSPAGRLRALGGRHEADRVVVREGGGLARGGVRMGRMLPGDAPHAVPDDGRSGRVGLAGGAVGGSDGGGAQAHGGRLRGRGAVGQVIRHGGRRGREAGAAVALAPGGEPLPLGAVCASRVRAAGVGEGGPDAGAGVRRQGVEAGRRRGPSDGCVGHVFPYPSIRRMATAAPIMGESDLMLDTHAVARSLTAADFTPAQADALTDALRLVVEQGDHVTSDQFKVGMAEMRTEIAEVRTEIANLDSRLSTQISTTETRLTWRMLGIAGLVIAALRLLG